VRWRILADATSSVTVPHDVWPLTGGEANVRSTAGQRPDDHRTRSDHGPRADRDARDHDGPRAELAPIGDRDIPREVDVGVERDEVAEYVVVRHLAVQIDGRELSHARVDGQNGPGADIGALSERHVRSDHRARMHDGRPRQLQRSEPGDYLRFRPWEPNAHDEANLTIDDVLAHGVEAADDVSEAGRKAIRLDAIVEEEKFARHSARAHLFAQRPRYLLRESGRSDHKKARFDDTHRQPSTSADLRLLAIYKRMM
jgi:hypothetical protein